MIQLNWLASTRDYPFPRSAGDKVPPSPAWGAQDCFHSKHYQLSRLPIPSEYHNTPLYILSCLG